MIQATAGMSSGQTRHKHKQMSLVIFSASALFIVLLDGKHNMRLIATAAQPPHMPGQGCLVITKGWIMCVSIRAAPSRV